MRSFALRGLRPAAGALAVSAALLAAATACSSPGSSSASSTPTTPTASATTGQATGQPTGQPTAPATPASASASPAVSMTPLAPAAGQLTGTQLESVLLPEADFPAGFATPTTGPISSGGSLTTGPATYNLATVTCATFIQHFGTTGFGETAMVEGSVSASGQAFDQFIYQFPAAAQASAFVTGIRSLAARCASFTANANGTSGTFSLRATASAAVGGHPALELLETGTLGGSKIVLDTLLCASGVDVFAASGLGVGGAAAPVLPAKQTIVYELMQRQAAAAVLS